MHEYYVPNLKQVIMHMIRLVAYSVVAVQLAFNEKHDQRVCAQLPCQSTSQAGEAATCRAAAATADVVDIPNGYTSDKVSYRQPGWPIDVVQAYGLTRWPSCWWHVRLLKAG
jgi:hypothetical protein